MVYVIDLVTSSSPSTRKLRSSPSPQQTEKSFDYFNPKFPSSSSPFSSLIKPSRNGINSKSGLSKSFTDNEAYEKFKREWRKNREQESESDSVEIIKSPEPVPTSFMNHLMSPVGIKRRRTSDTFVITPTRTYETVELKLSTPNDNEINTVNITRINTNNTARINTPKINAVIHRTINYHNTRGFKNKAEAINSIRIYMSNPMAEAYEFELRRRFTERQMIDTVSFDISSVLIPSEMASFRWKFCNAEEFLEPRLFVLDSEALWNEFIATKRFNDLLLAYNEPNVFLYFINWKRAAQKHTTALNKQFKQALNTSGETINLVPANELENEFFLTAAQLRLQVNFSGASNQTQALVDLMDFVIEMTRVVALKGYLKESRSQDETNFDRLNLTLARDIKVKSGKDARDCWIKTLCQIPRVTPNLAEVVVARYPSFCALMDAYNSCSTTKEGEDLLAGLRLDDGNNRRLGPIISARIYNHFQ